MSTAEPTMVTNMTPTSTAMTYSNILYFPSQTMPAPISPIAIANQMRSTCGNSATSGSAELDIAAAP